MTGARDQSLESSQSDWSTKFCKLFLRVADKHGQISQERKTAQNWTKTVLRVTSNRIGKLELCCDVKRKQIFVEYVADRNPVMASNRLQIAMKRLACCNILGSGFPSGIKVSFENIVSEIISDYTLI